MLVFAVSFLHERKSLFWDNWLKKLQNDKEIAQSRKLIPKRKKLFGKVNLFSATYSSESAISCYKHPEKIFLTKGPTFFLSQIQKEVDTLCNFSKKMLNLRKFERYAGCNVDNHAGNSTLKVQKNFAQNGEKKQNSNFFLSK